MALKLNCLEQLTAIGIGIGAFALAPFDAGLSAGAAIGGAGLFARVRENMRKLGLDDDRLIARMQMSILREWDRWDATPAMRDAATEADAAMARLLPQAMVTRAELAAVAAMASDEAYPVRAARLVVDRLAGFDPMFAATADDALPSQHRAFALHAIERALRAAMSDPQYAQLLTLDIAIELGRASAENAEAVADLAQTVEEVRAAIQPLAGEVERLSLPALRGAVSRFLAIRPGATIGEIVEAIESFIPEHQALLARVAALDAHDKRLKGVQEAAAAALANGDLDTTRERLDEATRNQLETAAVHVRDTATGFDRLADVHMLALDWPSAVAAWTRAVDLLRPFDLDAAEDLADAAARRVCDHGMRFADVSALRAAADQWRQLRSAAAARGDCDSMAIYGNNLANALHAQALRFGGEEGWLLLVEAVDAYREALAPPVCAGSSAFWALGMNNLAIALQTLGERSGSDAKKALFLADAELVCRQVLAVQPRGSIDWARTMNNLGNVLHAQGVSAEADQATRLLTEAAAAFRDALTVCDRDDIVVEWATTTANLANTLALAGERMGGEEGLHRLGEAVTAYNEVFTVRTRVTMPADWAQTKENLALAHEGMADAGDAPRTNFLAAEAALCDALTVYTCEHTPYDHATATASLARVRRKLAGLGD